VILLLLGVSAGAAVPHLLAGRLPGPSGEAADVILVLSGGENRIQEGFRAWKEGKGRELYILGAGKGAKLERILPGHPALSPGELRSLYIEGWSENTLENAFSAKAAVSERGYTRLILLTSDYHMPRAYLAFHRVLPKEISIAVIPVRSEWRNRNAFFRTLRLFFVEGWKYWGYRFFLYWE